MSRSEVWFIRPRDPLVLGDGRGPAAFAARRAWPLPLPQTLAGMVRAQFVRDAHDVERDRALALLQQVSVEGPWLVRRLGDTTPAALTPFAFAPADARREQDEDPARPGAHRLHRDRLVDLGADQGALWPAGAPPLPTVVAPHHQVNGRKTVAPSALWPLADAVAFALGRGPTHDPGLVNPVQSETRVHVALDDDTGTADPTQLFASAGARFQEGFGLLVRVTASAALEAGLRWPGPHDVVVLGGEARPSFRALLDDASYPAFSHHQGLYEQALAEHLQRHREPPGLRLQLLTHACLYQPDALPGTLACLPPWLRDGEGAHPRAPELRLRLRALRLAGAVAVSGWDLQGGSQRRREGAPRQVRRLVPAGTVYYFDVLGGLRDAAVLSRALAALFAAPLAPQPDESAAPAADQHQTHPARDGMGLCLPGLFARETR